jgi:RecA-family ATPase
MTMTPRNVTPAKAKAKVPTIKYDVREEDLPEAIEDGTRTLIKMLFAEGEGVRICKGHFNEEKKEVPEDGGVCLTREEWLRRLDAKNGNINKIFASSDKCGIYVGINPYKIGCTKDADVIAFRHALFEFDDGLSCGEQLNLYRQMKLPAAALIYSGGKSVHAWVKIDAQNRQEYDERVALLFEHFESAGFKPDIKNKNPGRLSRLPGCVRFKARQELLAVNLDVSFTEWVKTSEADEIGPCDNFETLSELDPTNDPNCVVGFIAKDGGTVTTRYLCRGKSAWLLGPSGIGKSTLMTDFAIPWALGRPAYGISVGGVPRRSLIIQAENDRYDLAEMVQGIGAAHGLHSEFTPEEFALVKSNVLFKTETRKTGQGFVDWMHRLIDRERPDFVWIDPMLAFMGLDVNKQSEVTHFLRTLLTPVLEATGAILIGVHHTGKPPGAKVTAHWTAIDYAYAGLGSSELVNWARAVMFLKPVDDHNFELKLAKRGSRAKATHPDGQWTNSVWLRHAETGIKWEQVEPPAEEEPKERGEGKPKEPKLTKPEIVNRTLGMSFFNSIPSEGEGLRPLISRMADWMTSKDSDMKMVVSKTTGERAVELMLRSSKVKCEKGMYFKGPNA